jgi:phage shock protein PspC (stress-responsive transcriptional regulator)
MSATAAQPNLFFREDTLFGVCEALGEDFGINPTWLRIAFAAPLMWNPAVVIAAYAATGVVVLASRLLAPNPPRAAATAAIEAPAEVETAPTAAGTPEMAMAA